MIFFKKKWDYKRDNLKLGFSLNEKKYYYYYIYITKNRLDYSLLNRRTKKALDQKNRSLASNPNLLAEEIRKAKATIRFAKLQQAGYDNTSFSALTPITGTMSESTKKFLEIITNEEDVLLGINRVGENIDDDRIHDTFTNGLPITGHYWANNEQPTLDKNVSYYEDNKTIINELMAAREYKGARGCFLIRIPDEDLCKTIIHKDSTGVMRLGSNYVVGYVPLGPNNHLEDIILNDNNDYARSYQSNQSPYGFSGTPANLSNSTVLPKDKYR